MPPRQQPVMHLAHELRTEHRDRRRSIEEAHQAQGRVRRLRFGGIDPDRNEVGPRLDRHLRGQVGDDCRVEFQHEGEVGRGDAGSGDLAHRRDVRRHQEGIARPEREIPRAHGDMLAALQNQTDQRSRDVVEQAAGGGRPHGREPRNGGGRDAGVVSVRLRVAADGGEKGRHGEKPYLISRVKARLFGGSGKNSRASGNKRRRPGGIPGRPHERSRP